MIWIVEKVTHSGRKGIRGEEIPDHEATGYKCKFEVEDIKQFKPLQMDFVDNPYYEYWGTTEVLETGWIKHQDKNVLSVETANSIYYFMPVEESEDEAE